MAERTSDAVRVPRYQLDLWTAMVNDAKAAAVTEHASTTYGILVCLAGYLKDAAKVAEPQPAPDIRSAGDPTWDADYAAAHPGERPQWRDGAWVG